ncbi:MAG: hypothetical protein ACYDH6_16070 [Acidimicrobiales bacterium]
MKLGRLVVWVGLVGWLVLWGAVPASASVSPTGVIDLGLGGAAISGPRTCTNSGALVGQGGMAPYGGDSATIDGGSAHYLRCAGIIAGTGGWGAAAWVSIPSMSTDCSGNGGCVIFGGGGGNGSDFVVALQASGNITIVGVSGCSWIAGGPYFASGVAAYLGVSSTGPGDLEVFFNGASVATCTSSGYSAGSDLLVGASGDSYWNNNTQTLSVEDLSYWLGYRPVAADLQAAKSFGSGTTTTTTSGTGGGGSTCGGPGQPACNTNISTDSGGFFGGLASSIGGFMGGVTSGITGAISSAVTSVISGITTALQGLFVPSTGTQSSFAHAWDGITSKAPFSVAYEVVTFVPASLTSLKSGVDGGPASCTATTTHLCVGSALADVAAQPGVSIIRACELVAIALGFLYGIYRAVNAVIDR